MPQPAGFVLVAQQLVRRPTDEMNLAAGRAFHHHERVPGRVSVVINPVLHEFMR